MRVDPDNVNLGLIYNDLQSLDDEKAKKWADWDLNPEQKLFPKIVPTDTITEGSDDIQVSPSAH